MTLGGLDLWRLCSLSLFLLIYRNLPEELRKRVETVYRTTCISCGQICIPHWSFLAHYSLTYPSKYQSQLARNGLVRFHFRRRENICGHHSCFETEYWNELYRKAAKVGGGCILDFRCDDLIFDFREKIQFDPDYVTPKSDQSNRPEEELDDYGLIAWSVSKEIPEPVDKLEWKVLLMNKWRDTKARLAIKMKPSSDSQEDLCSSTWYSIQEE